MTTEELAIILTAKFDQVQQALSTVQKDLDNYAAQAEKSGQRVDKSFDLAALAIIGAGVELNKFLGEAVMTADASERLGLVLDNMGGAAGYSKDQLDEEVTAIEALNFSGNDARNALIRLVQAHVDLASATKLAALAQDFAISRGMDATEVFNTMTRAIQSGRPLMLQQLGLTGNVAQAQERYAESLGTTAALLTDQQKKQAVVNALLDGAKTSAGNYALVVETLGIKLKTLKNVDEKASISIGTVFIPVMKEVVSIAINIVKWFNEQNVVVKTIIGLVVGAVAAYVGLVGILRTILVVGPQLVAAFTSVNAVLMANPWAIYATAGAIAITGILALLDQLDKHIDKTNDAISSAASNVGGPPVTASDINAKATATEKLATARRMLAQANAGLALLRNETGAQNDEDLGKGRKAGILTQAENKRYDFYAEQQKEAQAFVDKYAKMTDAQKKSKDMYGAELQAAREKIDYVLAGVDLEVAKIEEKRNKELAIAQNEIGDERVKAELIKEINETADLQIMTAKRQINTKNLFEYKAFLEEMKRNDTIYAKDKIAIDRQLAATEQEIHKQMAENLKGTLQYTMSLMGNAAGVWFDIGKAAAVAMATIDGIAAVQKALASAPPPFNFALAAVVGAATIANVNSILGQQPPTFKDNFAAGGFVGGNAFMGDNVPIMANSGELMLTMSDQAELLSRLRSGGGGSGSPVIVHHSPTFSFGTPSEAKRSARIIANELNNLGVFS